MLGGVMIGQLPGRTTLGQRGRSTLGVFGSSALSVIYVDLERFVGGGTEDGVSWDTAFDSLNKGLAAYDLLLQEFGDSNLSEEEEYQIMKKYPIWVKASNLPAALAPLISYNDVHTRRNLRVYGGMREEYTNINQRTDSDFTLFSELALSAFFTSTSQNVLNGFHFVVGSQIITSASPKAYYLKFQRCKFDLSSKDEDIEIEFDATYAPGGGVVPYPTLFSSLPKLIDEAISPFSFDTCTFMNLDRTYSITRTLAVVASNGGRMIINSLINTPLASYENITFDSINQTINGMHGIDDQLNQDFYSGAPGTITSAGGNATEFYIDPIIDCSSMGTVTKVNSSLSGNAADLEGGDNLPRVSSGGDGQRGGNSFFGRAGNGGDGGGPADSDGGDGGTSFYGTSGLGGNGTGAGSNGSAGSSSDTITVLGGGTKTIDDVYDFVSGDNYLHNGNA